jgi:hypothetical protein
MIFVSGRDALTYRNINRRHDSIKESWTIKGT